jgi:hypothetical protein
MYLSQHLFVPGVEVRLVEWVALVDGFEAIALVVSEFTVLKPYPVERLQQVGIQLSLHLLPALVALW